MRRGVIAPQLEGALRTTLRAPDLQLVELDGERTAHDEEAQPWISVMTASRPWTRTPSTARTMKVVPTIESWRSCAPGARRPSAASSAARAELPEPQGDRSTSPSAKMATLRWWRGPSRSYRITP